jgi:hypothetical protein
MQARPALRFSDAARRRLVGGHAPHVQHGGCQRGAAKRPGPRPEGAICPETLANNLVKRPLRDLAALFNGSLQALAQAGRLGATSTGSLDATDLATTQH